jgi:competence protein ComGC
MFIISIYRCRMLINILVVIIIILLFYSIKKIKKISKKKYKKLNKNRELGINKYKLDSDIRSDIRKIVKEEIKNYIKHSQKRKKRKKKKLNNLINQSEKGFIRGSLVSLINGKDIYNLIITSLGFAVINPISVYLGV